MVSTVCKVNVKAASALYAVCVLTGTAQSQGADGAAAGLSAANSRIDFNKQETAQKLSYKRLITRMLSYT